MTDGDASREEAEVEAGTYPTEEQMRENVVRLVFGGDETKFRAFVDALRDAFPPETTAILRGSAVTGFRWSDGEPFDTEGPGTSDLDLTLIGGHVIECYTADGFFVPGVHSKPLSDDDRDIAPDLVPLRERLIQLAGRPVNIQATRDFVKVLRGDLLGQPYLTLVGKTEAS